MTNTTAELVDIPMDELLAEARELGAEHGKAAGTWIFDGNTPTEAYRRCLELDTEGDPEWHDLFGVAAPLSGEWADGLTPQSLIRDELELDPETVSGEEESEICSAYETAYFDAARDEVLRVARYQLAG